MSEEAITYEVVDGVAWLTINRPEARNALNGAVRQGLFDTVHRFNADDSAKVAERLGREVGEGLGRLLADQHERTERRLQRPC